MDIEDFFLKVSIGTFLGMVLAIIMATTVHGDRLPFLILMYILITGFILSSGIYLVIKHEKKNEIIPERMDNIETVNECHEVESQISSPPSSVFSYTIVED